MIDSSIALGVKPFQIESQANNLANILKLQELQQGGQLNALKLQEAQRGVEQQNNLRSILSGVQPTDTPDAVAQRLMRGGFLNESSKYQQVNRENEMNAAKKREHDLNAAQKSNEIAGSIFGAIKANPTPEMVQSGLSYLNSKGILPEKEMQLFMQQYSQAQTPEKIAELAGLHHLSAVPAKDQAPKIDTRNTGGFTETFATDPFSGEVKILNRAQNTQSPDSVVSNETQRRGQNMVDARSREANKIANEGKVATTSTTLRKEFDDLPEVKNYKQAVPAYRAVEDAASRNTTAADINLVYGIAKLYDPNSVVREGEYATIAKSPNIPEKIKGYAQYLTNGGRLTDNVKKDILTEARGRMGSFEQSYEGARKGYESIASRSGAEPTLLFPSTYQSVVQKPKAAKIVNFGDLK
jgi:hypothetical protein